MFGRLLNSFVRRVDPTLNLGANKFVLDRVHYALPVNLAFSFRETHPFSNKSVGLNNQGRQFKDNAPISYGLVKRPVYYDGNLGYFEDE